MQETVQQDGPVSLVERVRTALYSQIDTGKYQPGDRLPSEAKLTAEFSVSRTVIREAIAILRSDGVLEARKGSGVFARDIAENQSQQPFADINPQRISEVIELLEMRSAVEIRAAGLAASRRSPIQLEKIIDAHEKVGDAIRSGRPTRDLDFEFHYAIAEATQNGRFPQFLALIREGIAPRSELAGDRDTPATSPNPVLQDEHGAVVDAIVEGDAGAAETAMKQHLNGSLRRYRAILRESFGR